MKHLIRFAAVMAAAAFLALPLGAQSRGGHSSGHGNSASSSYSNNHSRSGSSHSHVDGRRGSSPSGDRAVRPSGGSSTNRPSGDKAVRPSGNGNRPSNGGHSGGIANRPSNGGHSGGIANRPSNGGHSGGIANRPSNGSGSANRPSNGGNRPSGHADRPSNGGPGRGYADGNRNHRPGEGVRPNGSGNHRPAPGGSVNHRPKPGSRPYADGHRPAPTHMGHVHVNHRPGYNPPRPAHRELRGTPVRFTHHGRHCYGHYITVLPPHYIHRVYHGIDYYFWDDVWYRYRAGRYWVCRPPFGYAFTPLADAVFTAILLNSLVEDNDSAEAREAQSLNLIRNYAAAGTEYFYNDGVFYIKEADGQYVVIVPPAGAMVDSLPDDFETFEFDGNTYYKVDDTVYRMTVTEDGKACFEVLGQLAE